MKYHHRNRNLRTLKKGSVTQWSWGECMTFDALQGLIKHFSTSRLHKTAPFEHIQLVCELQFGHRKQNHLDSSCQRCPSIRVSRRVRCVCVQSGVPRRGLAAWLHQTACTGPARSTQLRLRRTEHNSVRTMTITKDLLVELCDWHFLQNCFLQLAKMHKRRIIRQLHAQ